MENEKMKGFGREEQLSGDVILAQECNVDAETQSILHNRLCQCGCVPSNMLSLFEMAELRKKLKEKKERKKNEQEKEVKS
jgi:hypothetical protein